MMEWLSKITPEIAKAGVFYYGDGTSIDILTHMCHLCDAEEDALFVAKRLVELGYMYADHEATRYSDMFNRKRWRLLWFCEKRQWFGRFKQDKWIEEQFAFYPKYRAFRARESVASKASIALIGVGMQLKREPGVSDAMRIIARVVYSDWQLEADWESLWLGKK
jgi:hypothetical protein